jgi:hypothetical protein
MKTLTNRDEMLDELGYWQGATFEGAEQVREYLHEMNRELSITFDEQYANEDIDALADYAIEHRLHWTE